MKAMVLCAGYGTRLGDLTRETPKPMLPLGDRPMLEYILCHLKRHGFDQVAVNLHFMPEAIQNHFVDGYRWGLRLRIVNFLERPTEEQRRGVESSWVFSGVTLCEPEFLDAIPPDTVCDLPRDIFIEPAPTGRLFAFSLTDQRCAVDSRERLAEARKSVRLGHYRLA